MKVNEYKNGEVVFRQGDFATTFFKILNGSVGVYFGYGSKDEKQLTTLHAGDYLGEMAVIEAYPRSATAVVLEDGTKMEEISEKELDSYFTDRSGDLFQIIRQLAQRVRERTDDYEDPGHGHRAAQFIDSIRPRYLANFSDVEIDLLKEACRQHETGTKTGNKTIDICLDADRLDLPRLGISPTPRQMVTRQGKELAKLLADGRHKAT